MILINEESQIPLFGLDWMGILDRGTNLIEVKPLTTCNLKCKYCFVCSGDYDNNFTLEPDYVIKWLKKALLIKGVEDAVELHVAPYGEFFQYQEYEKLIRGIRSLPQVKTISIQTNGTLIKDDIIKKLESAGVTRLNVSFNSLDPELAKSLSGNPNYNVKNMLNLFDKILKSKMDLLIAPIWFFGKNDGEIIKIIELAKKYEKMGYNNHKFRLGIQNYLVYKTGRKLSRVKEREFKHFYKMLGKLEKKFDIKLKLGPNDFNIHRSGFIEPPVLMGEIKRVQILSEGRNPGEYIGGLNHSWAVKVLSKFSLEIGSKVNIKIIKRRRNENLITGRLIY
jgi:hypothetical protein